MEKLTDRWIEVKTGRQTDGQMDGSKDSETDRRTYGWK